MLLLQHLAQALAQDADEALAVGRAELPDTPRFGDILYRCKAMAEVIQRARRVSARAVSVLIEGESGTGKELLARAIHDAGPRQSRSTCA